MGRILQIELTDEDSDRLEAFAKWTGRTPSDLAESIVHGGLEHVWSKKKGSYPLSFEAALEYALDKNKELLRRLAQ